LSVARPLPDPVLFLDECLGTKDVAEALRSVGARVEALLDHFESGCPDEQWLPAVAKKLHSEGSSEWVVLTKDSGFDAGPARELRSRKPVPQPSCFRAAR
jgi:hypothetical protein